MQAFDVLGDPIRRRILEPPAGAEQTAGTVAGLIRTEFGISRLRRFWSQRLDALGAELARGRRERSQQRHGSAGAPPVDPQPPIQSEEET